MSWIANLGGICWPEGKCSRRKATTEPFCVREIISQGEGVIRNVAHHLSMTHHALPRTPITLLNAPPFALLCSGNMPTYRSITLSLISQYDILTIPEYAPPKTAVDPFSNAPTLISPDNSLVSVYIPTYPSSQFWLSYSISPPHPPNLLYYFKLYINRQHVVSWGCGHDDGYKGKTMFGLYDSGHGTPLSPGLERRVLCFTSDLENGRMPDTLSDVMEIKVFRSKGRKRVRPTVQEFTAPASKVRNLKNSLRQPSSAGIE